MARRVPAVWLSFLVGLAGCVPGPNTTALVPPSPLSGPVPTTSLQNAKLPQTPGNSEVAVRVATVGRQIVAANPQIGARPQFMTVGADWDEVFHRGDAVVVVTEGLARKCVTDGQLAAVLALELGKIVAEREGLGGAGGRVPVLDPPPDVPVGSDAGGTFGSPDGTRLAELGKYTNRERRTTLKPTVGPDPLRLARGYLTRASFAPDELNGVVGLLRSAEGNARLEKQMTAGSTVPNGSVVGNNAVVPAVGLSIPGAAPNAVQRAVATPPAPLATIGAPAK